MRQTNPKKLPPILHVQGVATILLLIFPALLPLVFLLNTVAFGYFLAPAIRHYRTFPVKILALEIFFLAVTLFVAFYFTIAYTETSIS